MYLCIAPKFMLIIVQSYGISEDMAFDIFLAPIKNSFKRKY